MGWRYVRHSLLFFFAAAGGGYFTLGILLVLYATNADLDYGMAIVSTSALIVLAALCRLVFAWDRPDPPEAHYSDISWRPNWIEASLVLLGVSAASTFVHFALHAPSPLRLALWTLGVWVTGILYIAAIIIVALFIIAFIFAKRFKSFEDDATW